MRLSDGATRVFWGGAIGGVGNQTVAMVSADLATFAPLAATGQAVFGRNAADPGAFDADAAAAGSVLPAANGADLLLFYHAQKNNGATSANGEAYSSIGLARSNDNGLTWTRHGQVVTGITAQPTANFPRATLGALSPSVIVANGFYYMFYVDLGFQTGPDVIHVARASVSSGGAPGAWQKWRNGSFSEPGIGGSSTAVQGREVGAATQATFLQYPSVTWNTYLQKYLMVFQANDGVYYSTSSDLTTWTPQGQIMAFGGSSAYSRPTFLSPEQSSDQFTGQTGYLYYAKAVAGQTTTLFRRPMNLGATAAALAAPLVVTAAPTALALDPSGAGTLAVRAAGPGPLSYQWSKDGVALSGAVSSSYEIPSFTADLAGAYTVTVTDVTGRTVTTAPVAVSAAAVPVVGAEQPLLPVGQFGLRFTPDDAISYFKEADGTARVFWAGGTSNGAGRAIAMTTRDFVTFTPLVTEGGNAVAVMQPSGPGTELFDADYSGPGTVLRAANGADLIMIYHSENNMFGGVHGPPIPFYASIGLARSGDNGRTWTRIGQIISGSAAKPATPATLGAAAPSVIAAGGYLYCFFNDIIANGANVVHLARAPIETDGAPGTWMKWHRGSFSQPGLGGASTAVQGQAPPGITTVQAGQPSVSFNTFLQRYVMLFYSHVGFHYSTSSDLITWTHQGQLTQHESPQVANLLRGQTFTYYPTFLSPDEPTSLTTNQAGFIYFAKGRWEEVAHTLHRRPLAFETSAAPSFVQAPQAVFAAAGENPTLRAAACRTTAGYAWERNGVEVANAAGPSLTLANLQPAHTGLYRATARNGSGPTQSSAAIVGLAATAKTTGEATEVGPNIVHSNGNTFDQVLLEGPAATVTADPGQILRVSFVDPNDDIVQLEFSGAGSLSIVLANHSGPAPPAKYNQSVTYMKGHAGIVVVGANETTNLSVFSVGRGNAVNTALFRSDTTYDGYADIAFIAIASANGKFGGLRTANASYFATRGITGVYAPGVEFMGPVFVGNINAFDNATPVLVLGAAADVRVTGGDLRQENGRALQIAGVPWLQFAAGSNSHGAQQTAQTNRARLERNGVDITHYITP